MRPPSRSVASRTVVKVLVCAACLITMDGPSREALQKPAKEPVERHNPMTLDRSALLEVLDALKAADVGDRVRQAHPPPRSLVTRPGSSSPVRGER